MAHIISVSGLSKRYTLRHVARPRYESLREVLSERVRRLVAGARSNAGRDYDEEFWALKDVGFTLEPGDRLGIIGRNGAGKSTLLKILSRITEPTTGRIELRGRVSSLLEVGTGFHPELTGRENIFLNGTILGMTSREIRRKFDEIVAFAEVEQFLDTPAKRYSSGMYVRLAFSVAAHLEPQILVVDEVLSVGDAQFQKKCLGKMKEVTGEGRTVLFVSHNMTTVTSLCNRCLLLERGRVKALGDPADVTGRYLASDEERSGSTLRYASIDKRPGSNVARLVEARLVDRAGNTVEHVRRDQQIGAEMTFEVLAPGSRLVPNIHVFTQGQYAFVSSPRQDRELALGTYRSTMWIPPRLLNEGLYVLGIALSSMSPVVVHFFEQEALHFTVVDDLRDPHRNDYTQAVPGPVRPQLEWHLETLSESVPG
jgi:lipopolysaccharide transport system ATP-binding protein